MKVSLDPGDIVLDGDPAPQFSAHIRCGQTAGWIKMPHGMKVGFGPCDFVLDGDPAPPSKKGREHSIPQFLARPLWPNGWMD